MIYSDKTIDLINAAEELTSALLHSETGQAYISAKQARSNSAQAQDVIRDFNRIKEEYELVQRFGRYHPDYQTITKKVHEVKRALDLQEEVATFKKAEKQLETLLGQISLKLAGEVSPQIKVPTGNPFFDQGCAGGCSTGGSCSCSG
ncbi:YlbF family regulator [Exiguobacterium sp. s133]|uniref:YlbF family regulator n=1 Tax=Exiguobacterium sp. s133 TaxID=2751213 RepID=UPI001BE981A8